MFLDFLEFLPDQTVFVVFFDMSGEISHRLGLKKKLSAAVVTCSLRVNATSSSDFVIFVITLYNLYSQMIPFSPIIRQE